MWPAPRHHPLSQYGSWKPVSVAERFSSANLMRKPSLTEWLDSLDADDLAAVERAGLGPAKDTALETAIRAENVAVSIHSVRAWRDSLRRSGL